ncbi:triose-phosphate isomerase [Sulfobacillus harzensis]|uniref:Triosephosphate isomerase n=1 Tax=Sulfobacillus harzensis TaxID=2729629 RepID=A0A7Y0L2M0_9FIRM|nr:triose-phosphate isomerase [Sulfobacillus harzensis]NMP22146.1 triose-phosphate isomerase [Sulfobacillus harzensis]
MVSSPLIVANWKMHKTVRQSIAFARELLRRRDEIPPGIQEVICPTLPALYSVSQVLAWSGIQTGAQTLDLGREGANTGAVSAFLVRETGAAFVILGHSERRNLYGEDDALVAEKTRSALDAHLIPIICVGESPEERKRGRTDAVIRHQVRAVVEGLTERTTTALVFAYEPLWAIGTGQVPEPDEANRVARLARTVVHETTPQFDSDLRILYGGSVNAGNASGFANAPEIDGALVGGASLDINQWIGLNIAWGEGRP